jgi:hypothetical protein
MEEPVKRKDQEEEQEEACLIKRDCCRPGVGENAEHMKVGVGEGTMQTQTGSLAEGIGRNENRRRFSA